MTGGAALIEPMCARPRRLCALLLALAFVFPRAALGDLSEEVRAAYLLKLPQFVTWPPVAGPAQTAFNLCIVGETSIGELVDRAAAGERVGGKAIVVAHLAKADLNARCQVMYIAGEPAFVAQTLASVSGYPVLTITDSQKDEATRGVVNFVTVDNKERFEIDRTAADRNHLQISSKLLTIAVTVYPARSTP